MKSVKKRIVSILMCVCILLGMIVQGGGFELFALSLNRAIIGTTETQYKNNASAELGTEDNPLTILEIVPVHNAAQIGYFIPGCEPIDLSAVSEADVQGIIEQSTLKSIYSSETENEYSFYDLLPAESNIQEKLGGNYETRTDLKYSAYSAYEQWKSAYNADYSVKGYYEAAEKGNFTQDGDSYKYTPGSGTHNWVTSDSAPEGYTLTKRTGDDGLLVMCTHRKLVNNDEFIAKVFDEESARDGKNGYHSQVIVMTSAEVQEDLEKNGDKSVLQVADMICIHDARADESQGALMHLYNSYALEGAAEEDDLSVMHFWDSDKKTGETLDLSYDVTMAIMQRMASTQAPALVVDKVALAAGNADFSEGKEYNDLNCYKLLLMALQYDVTYFWNTFGSYLEAKKVDGSEKIIYTKAATKEEQLYWDRDTFKYSPSGEDISGKKQVVNVNSGEEDVLPKIFAYDGTMAMLQSFLSDTESVYYPSDQSKNIVVEDAFSFNGKDYEKDGLTYWEILKYIFGKRVNIPKLRVLEIQPCSDFIYGNDSYKTESGGDWKSYYEGLFKGYNPATDEESWVLDDDLIDVTTMPTWEFNGSTGRYDYTEVDESTGDLAILTPASSDDLVAKYDMIIIGSNQNKSNGLNGYNDTALGHLIYTAVGDLVKYYSESDFPFNYSSNATKQQKTAHQIQEDEYRYSSNDFTLKKTLELQDFLRAGKPIVVDGKLFTSKSNKTVDTTKVDSSSKIYDLLTWKDSSELKANENLLVYGAYSTGKVKSMITKNQCKLVFYDDEERYPLDYGYTEASSTYDGVTVKSAIGNEYYQQKNEEGKAILTYHFYVAGVAGEQYRLYLHIDLDGDGVYRGSLKEYSEIANMSAATGETYSYDNLETALSMKIYKAENGKRTYMGKSDSYTLEPYQEYYATYELSDDQLGIVPWKLEVNAVSNEYQRSSAINYTAFAMTEEPGVVNVLQMCLPSDMGPNDSYGNADSESVTYFTSKCVDLGSSDCWNSVSSVKYYGNARHYYNPDYDYTTSNYSSVTTKNKGGNTARKFEAFLEPVNEFNVNIQFMRIREWVELFADGAVDKNGKKLTLEQRTENWKSFLAQYDMIILGFVDGNCFTSNEVFVQGFKDFAAQGKGIILSHDTVASANFLYEPGGWFYRAYNDYSPWIRTFSGQRCAYYHYNEETGLYEKYYTEQYSQGKNLYDMQELAAKVQSLTYQNTKGQYYQFTEAIDSDVVDEKFYGTYTMENLDNANQLYARRPNRNYKSDRVTASNNGNASESGWPSQTAMTQNIRLTNNGQITSYPYQLDEYLQVLSTHTQNYRLDMEYNEGGDVNVWYSLTDTKDPNAKINWASKDVDLYSGRSQDAQNSFFIYNKGNITYTGLGHVGCNNVMPDDEVKLFINTMISAYRQPETSPYVEIDNASSVAADGSSLLYVDYDDSGSILDQSIVERNGQKMIRVEFSVHGRNSGSQIDDKKNYLTIVKDDEEEATNLLDICEAASDIALTSDEEKKYLVQASEEGVPYVLYVPYDEVESEGSVSVEFTTYSVYTRSGRKLVTPEKKTEVTVMLLPLFDLN